MPAPSGVPLKEESADNSQRNLGRKLFAALRSKIGTTTFVCGEVKYVLRVNIERLVI